MIQLSFLLHYDKIDIDGSFLWLAVQTDDFTRYYQVRIVARVSCPQ